MSVPAARGQTVAVVLLLILIQFGIRVLSGDFADIDHPISLQTDHPISEQIDQGISL
jgi:hypothetical protein